METKNPTLEDAKYVMARAKYVQIDEEAIDRVAREWAKRDFQLPKWDWYVDMGLSSEERFDHFMLSATIDAFFEEPGTDRMYITKRKGEKQYGAAGLFASLQRAEENGIPILDGKYLMNLTAEEARKIFNNVSADGELCEDENPIPMLEERVKILNGVGKKLVEEYDGRFHKILEKTGKKVKIVEFVEFLAAEFPEAFRDVSVCKENYVGFYKKAYLAAAQAYGNGCLEIEDPENSVVFADYVLPMVERHNGILKYSVGLAEAVDCGRMIEHDSEEEIEIRAGTVVASNMLKDRINFYRESEGLPSITGFHIDAAQWLEGVNTAKAGVRLKRNYTPTMDY